MRRPLRATLENMLAVFLLEVRTGTRGWKGQGANVNSSVLPWTEFPTTGGDQAKPECYPGRGGGSGHHIEGWI